jgi:hypothetical protein
LLLAGLAAVSTLAGCAAVTPAGRTPDSGAVAWQGTSSAGAVGCGPMVFAVAVLPPSPSDIGLAPVRGRADPLPAAGSKRSPFDDAWQVEGTVAANGTVMLEARQLLPPLWGARPYAVWHGVREDGRITLAEGGSPCRRTLVLARR